MTDCDAVMTIECEEGSSLERVIEAFQHLINTGTVWSLQGWYGRAAIGLIEEGLCVASMDS